MIRAIDEYTIVGCQTTLAFCKFVMKHDAFRSGNFDTHFVKHYFTPEVLIEHPTDDESKVAAYMANHLQKMAAKKTTPSSQQTSAGSVSKWKLNRLN
jgi:propionyl-CoA carboxylase alpha chain